MALNKIIFTEVPKRIKKQVLDIIQKLIENTSLSNISHSYNTISINGGYDLEEEDGDDNGCFYKR